MHQTPWTRKLGSLSSDRIPPRPSSANAVYGQRQDIGQGGKGKAKQQSIPTPNQPPKSKDVKKLESLLKALRTSVGDKKDPKNGCFCLARDHPLSPDVPICQNCGLILCYLNPPQYACPFCAASLLTPPAKAALITALEQRVQDILAKEADEREQAIQEARRSAGAFPALSESAKQSQSPQQMVGNPSRANLPPPAQDTHKVISITKKSKSSRVVTVSRSYTPTPVPSRPASRNGGPEEVDEEIIRIPPPTQGVQHAERQPDPRKPWENLLGDDLTYVPAYAA
ncbi:hypothetical protein AMATHDRAFT_54941 [Amanita thiersii Skay4041]|uniref:TRIP4/RQT4 C2HC5-type zinc finger domain-containing protein n=1 Tax=Amanita thiersii Skay4041 TaxID=703135 RepID=A0A2A9NYY2_9AGAR|nr:hypothetical protein AMATHDRAFT_54941 [Amanita thiersii Skay4041]